MSPASNIHGSATVINGGDTPLHSEFHVVILSLCLGRLKVWMEMEVLYDICPYHIGTHCLGI